MLVMWESKITFVFAKKKQKKTKKQSNRLNNIRYREESSTLAEEIPSGLAVCFHCLLELKKKKTKWQIQTQKKTQKRWMNQ